MKKLYVLILFTALISSMIYAQTITSITFDPAAPTSLDTITVFIRCDFNSGGCDGTVDTVSQIGNEIHALAQHCIGNLAVLCSDYDTVIIPPLAAGQYSFIYTLLTAQAPACSGVISSSDTAFIDVATSAEVHGLNPAERFQIFPNPSNGSFIIKTSEESCNVKIFSSEGKIDHSFVLSNKEAEINYPLSNGVYTIMIENKGGRAFSKLVIVR